MSESHFFISNETLLLPIAVFKDSRLQCQLTEVFSHLAGLKPAMPKDSSDLGDFTRNWHMTSQNQNFTIKQWRFKDDGNGFVRK